MNQRTSPTGLPLLAGFAMLALALLQSSCKTVEPAKPTSMALRYGAVSNPDNLKVKISLNNRALYVYEGEEIRWVAAVAIGKADKPTPTGNFKAFNKIARKRSGTYGFHVKGDEIIPGTSAQTPPGYRYVGYPMPWWIEFAAGGYGIHAGAVWPTPRTHGCLRLHRTIAKEFFMMIKEGTPIQVAHSLPEDATIGKNVPRPTDYDQPDSPRSVLITDAPLDHTEDVLF